MSMPKETPNKLKIAMLTFGSRGDMQPMFALGAHLQRDPNVEVLVCTSANNFAFCQKLGLTALSCWPDHEEAMKGDDAAQSMANGDASALLKFIGRLRAEHLADATAKMLTAMRSFKPSLILSGPPDRNLADALAIVLQVPLLHFGLQFVGLSAQTKSVLGERRFHYTANLLFLFLAHKLLAAKEAAEIRAVLGTS